MPVVTLNNGVHMPQLGFGVARVSDDDAEPAVVAALKAGYRSIDTAADYGNERGVGAALRASGLPRGDLFVTTKVRNVDHGRDSTLRAFDASLSCLGLDHVDLYLVHWPVPARGLYVPTWQALEALHAGGRARAIGVSNFEPAHLDAVLAAGAVVPAVNQVELHPWLPQRALRARNAALGIATQAWSPLAKGRLLQEPALLALAARRGATPAQVVLRWHLQLGTVVIPKTVTPARMRENLDALALDPLDAGEIAVLDGLDSGTRIGPHPDEFA